MAYLKIGWVVVDMKKQNKETVIINGCKRYDKKHNLEFNLTPLFVRQLIITGCSYCGENKLTITLDRIDNTIGHIESNVNACCVRCNLFRGTMPYKAWLLLIPILRELQGFGELEQWKHKFFYKKKT